MTDESWRPQRDEDEDEDFGPPLFADDPTGEVQSEGLSFGDSDTGPLPHWTQPPTGEIPRVLAASPAPDHTDDLDVWSSFSGQSPVWRDDPADDTARPLDELDELVPAFVEPAEEPYFDPSSGGGDSVPTRREPGRITIGTDPTDGGSSRPTGTRRPRPGDAGRGARPSRPARPAPSTGRSAAKAKGGVAGRDMPMAIAVGLGIAAVFIAAVKYKPWAVAIIVVLVLGLAAVEYFDRVKEKTYQPAFVPGIVACVAAPAAVYHYGISALPLVMMLAFVAAAVSFIASEGLESNPMPNMAITMLGITWIGVLGSFGAAILQFSTVPGARNIGTDTLCLLAVAVVANDVGALFVGSAVGRTPLRAWISPNKSVEGFLGGTVLTLGAMFLVGVADRSDTWNSTGDLLLLGLVVSIAAPIGDLTESMFKRNLDVKDFGSIVKGHGGVLDRFDGFLFALPAVYYLMVYLVPWATK